MTNATGERLRTLRCPRCSSIQVVERESAERHHVVYRCQWCGHGSLPVRKRRPLRRARLSQPRRAPWWAR